MKAFEYARGHYTDTVTNEIKTFVGTPDRIGSNLIWLDDADAEPQGVFVDSDTICHSTGLVDKNGKDIFTGDVLQGSKVRADNTVFFDVGTVVWLDDEAAFFVRRPPENSIVRDNDLVIKSHETIFERLYLERAKSFIIKEENNNE